MSARLAAEKAELEAVVAYLGQRLFQNAGDAAELRATLAATAKERDALKAEVASLKPAEPEPKPADEDYTNRLARAGQLSGLNTSGFNRDIMGQMGQLGVNALNRIIPEDPLGR